MEVESDVACEAFIYLREELVVSLIKPHHCLRAGACAEEGAGGLRSYCWCVSLLVLHSTSRAATHLHTHTHTQTHRHTNTPLVPVHPPGAKAWPRGALLTGPPSHVLGRHFRQVGGGASMQQDSCPTLTAATAAAGTLSIVWIIFPFCHLSQFINTSSLLRQGSPE